MIRLSGLAAALTDAVRVRMCGGVLVRAHRASARGRCAKCKGAFMVVGAGESIAPRGHVPWAQMGRTLNGRANGQHFAMEAPLHFAQQAKGEMVN